MTNNSMRGYRGGSEMCGAWVRVWVVWWVTAVCYHGFDSNGAQHASNERLLGDRRPHGHV